MLKQTLLDYLHSRHSDQFVKQWFEPLSIVMAENGFKRVANSDTSFSQFEFDSEDFAEDEQFIQVAFPHTLFAQWFMANARKEFEESIENCLGPQVRLEYVLDKNPLRKGFALPELKAVSKVKKSPFTFSSFITSGDAYFALETAQGITRGNLEPDIFNPFCVCGKSGCGKTHLLQALGEELRNQNNYMVFMSTPKELSDIYRHGGSNYLTRQNILAHQAFILDDLQQAKNKTELQDELVVLFDHFYTQGKIVAFGINCLPEQLDGFIFPLLTRLQRGVSAQLKLPDLELRSLFIRKRSKSCGLPLSDKQVLALATQFSSLRRLEGIINRATAMSYAQGKKVSNRDFEKMIREAGGVAISDVTSTRIIEVCSECFNISAADILGSKRSRQAARARHTAMYLCRDLLGSSFPELGNIFGGKDQSTAMYSVKKIDKLRKVDKETNKLVTNLKAKCLGLKN